MAASAPSTAATSRLTVTVTPSQSAFFAGELFTASITFSNPAPPAPSPTLHTLHSLSHLPLRSPALISPRKEQGGRWDRPPSSSHIGLAEYATSHLDSDEVPPSPFFGGNGHGTFGDGTPGASNGRKTSVDAGGGTGGGGALATPLSAAFGPLPTPRSLSGQHSPASTFASSSKPVLPTRKGLIGTPVVLQPAPPVAKHGRRMSSGGVGIYGTALRKPVSHGRAQSMAVSSPDLLERESLSRSVGKSRLGAPPAINGQAPAIVEHPPSPVAETFEVSSQSNGSSPRSTPSTSVSNASVPDKIKAHPHPYLTSLSQEQSQQLSSSFSLADSDEFDPTDAHASAPPGQTFYSAGKNERMDEETRAGMESWTRRASRGSQSAGPAATQFVHQTTPFDRGSLSASAIPSFADGRNPFLYPPNTLTLLWSFAHLEGTFEVDPTLIKPAEFIEVKRSLIAGFGSGLGGGTLDSGPESTGWRNWIWEGERTGGATLEARKANVMKERTIPTFSSPPSILGVDVVLEPGQSKTYKFSIRIPADLPPSFRGKAIKFSYHLVVGTNRSTLGPKLGPLAIPREAISRSMRVPVRVYNHVAVTGARPFYDLTNPIVYHRDEATIEGADQQKVVIQRARRPSTGLQDFERYTAALLSSVLDTSPSYGAVSAGLAMKDQRESAIIMEAPPALRPEMRARTLTGSAIAAGCEREGVQGSAFGESEAQLEGEGCKAAVEIVSRNSQKVSYDINKDGYLVASLTLVKSAYRLGETVNGSVVINSGDGRVLRVSARLETHEQVETSISTKPAAQLRAITKRLHAEHHESTLDSARVGFALAIPSGATPDFATSGVKLQWSVRLSFFVIPPSPDAPKFAKPPPERSGMLFNRTPKPPAPPGLNPSKHGRSKSFAYGFEPAVPLTLPAAPMVLPTGATHLMPALGPLDAFAPHVSYKAVPDLGFVPVLFSSAVAEPPATPGPLQRSAVGGMHRTTPSFSSVAKAPPTGVQASVVLVPAKYETVECSIPIKVYPGNTPFRPTVTIFHA